MGRWLGGLSLGSRFSSTGPIRYASATGTMLPELGGCGSGAGKVADAAAELMRSSSQARRLSHEEAVGALAGRGLDEAVGRWKVHADCGGT